MHNEITISILTTHKLTFLIVGVQRDCGNVTQGWLFDISRKWADGCWGQTSSGQGETATRTSCCHTCTSKQCLNSDLRMCRIYFGNSHFVYMVFLKGRQFLRHSKLAGIWIYGLFFSPSEVHFEPCFLFPLPSITSLKNLNLHFEMQGSTIQHSSFPLLLMQTQKYYQLGVILKPEILPTSAVSL